MNQSAIQDLLDNGRSKQLQELYKEWNPRGTTERMLVHQIQYHQFDARSTAITIKTLTTLKNFRNCTENAEKMQILKNWK